MKEEIDKSIAFDSSTQLELLSQKCQSMAPTIYKLHALYLQLLRSSLLETVKNAVFNLMVHKLDKNFDANTSRISQPFKNKINHLVAKCNSLLTVEHLMDLALEKEKENKLRVKDAKSLLLSSLESNSSKVYHDDEITNIELSSTPPIDTTVGGEEWSFYDDTIDSYEFYINDLDAEVSDDDDLESQYNSNYNEQFQDISEKEEDHKSDLEVLRSLFLIAEEALGSNPIKTSRLDKRSFNNTDIDAIEARKKDSYLPENPTSLFQWMNAFDYALKIRLRNLSNSLNLELFQYGHINSVVPISLLDAVLSGQVNYQHSNSNLLSLVLPMSGPGFSEGLEITCILLRVSELEFEDPRLRNCRSQISKYNNELIKMIRQQRHWQKRSLAQEVYQQWWQNPTDPPEHS